MWLVAAMSLTILDRASEVAAPNLKWVVGLTCTWTAEDWSASLRSMTLVGPNRSLKSLQTPPAIAHCTSKTTRRQLWCNRCPQSTTPPRAVIIEPTDGTVGQID